MTRNLSHKRAAARFLHQAEDGAGLPGPRMRWFGLRRLALGARNQQCNQRLLSSDGTKKMMTWTQAYRLGAR